MLRRTFLFLPAILLAGCDMSGPQSTLRVDGPVAQSQLSLFYITLGVTCFIFLTVGGVLAYTQWRFRARPGDESREPPPQTHGHPAVEMGLIIASTLLLVVIAVPTVRGIWYQEEVPEGASALRIRVTGFQWWFRFEYPDAGLTTANEMVIPVGKPVHLDLRTMDVIHSFWVPKLAGKRDLIPNRANSMWLQADEPGYYWAQCAEFCGESHANMKFRVIALAAPDFEAWKTRQLADARQPGAPTPPFAPSLSTEPATGFRQWIDQQSISTPTSEQPDLISKGRNLFATKTCAGCHTVRGHAADNGMAFIGISGPDLTHVGSRTTLAAAVLENTSENLKRWIQHPDTVKPGNLMSRDGGIGNTVTISNEEADALVAYLSSLK